MGAMSVYVFAGNLPGNKCLTGLDCILLNSLAIVQVSDTTEA